MALGGTAGAGDGEAAGADEAADAGRTRGGRGGGVEAVREVCERGLDASPDTVVGLDVPGLKILARDGLAVAWGLDHVRVEHPGGRSTDTWSRGTRVFERRDGGWVMVHKHLSVPLDPATGAARTDLRP